jgi:Tfp pilus assembly protein PilO
MKNLHKQSQWWKYAAGILPFACLIVLVLLELIGWSDLHNRVLFIILVGFFITGAIWWWWAIDKIINLTALLIQSDQKFTEIKEEIKEIKKEVESLDNR